MKCTITRSVDGIKVAESEEEGEKSEVIDRLHAMMMVNSRRAKTTFMLSPEVFGQMDEDGFSVWHFELKWEDDTTDDVVIPFPMADSTPYPEGEIEVVDVVSSVPLWPNPNEPLKFCINDSPRRRVQEEVRLFMLQRMESMPQEGLAALAELEMHIVVHGTFPDGETFEVMAGVVAKPKVDMPENFSDAIREILNELERSEDGDTTVG